VKNIFSALGTSASRRESGLKQNRPTAILAKGSLRDSPQQAVFVQQIHCLPKLLSQIFLAIRPENRR
jgi:hypothetical protein